MCVVCVYVCVCSYVCAAHTYTRMHTCTCTHMHTHIRTHMHTQGQCNPTVEALDYNKMMHTSNLIGSPKFWTVFSIAVHQTLLTRSSDAIYLRLCTFGSGTRLWQQESVSHVRQSCSQPKCCKKEHFTVCNNVLNFFFCIM